MSEVEVEIEEGVKLNEDGSITVELSEPIIRDRERIEAVTLRRPRIGDLLDISIKAIDERDFREGVKLISILSGLSTREVNSLDVGDYTLISFQIARLLRRRPRRSA